ncbi:MAG: SIMPL domain-containing protein [Pseudomonadota bacterium]
MTHNRPLRMLVPALAVLTALLTLSATTASAAKRIISLSASGTVKTKPDVATISTGVTSEGQTAQAALSKNTEAMTNVIDTLKGAGVEAKDIQTTDFSVSPIYEKKSKESQATFITGYRVGNNVIITVRDIKKLGDVLDKVVQAGANQIGAINFGIAEPERMKDEARKLAMQNAIDNAKLYAETAGVELGPVIKITETGDYTPRPYRATTAARAMVAESAPVPVEGGTMSVEAKVQVTWELR